MNHYLTEEFVGRAPRFDHEWIRLLRAIGVTTRILRRPARMARIMGPLWAVGVWEMRTRMPHAEDVRFRAASRTLLRFVSSQESADALAWILAVEFGRAGQDVVATLRRVAETLRAAGWEEHEVLS